MMIMHIMQVSQMKRVLMEGEYTPASLEKEGFIHCSTPEQVVDVANALYKGRNDLLLLQIDEKLVKPEIVYEDLYETGKLYPHIYGPLNMDAVIRIDEFVPRPDGTFELSINPARLN